MLRTESRPIITLVSAVALVQGSVRVLVQKRPEGKPMAGLWEFPGGKVEHGETAETALVRELREELGISVAISALQPLSFTTAGSLVLLLYMARQWEGQPQPLHATALKWVTPDEMTKIAMPPADMPFIAALRTALDQKASPS